MKEKNVKLHLGCGSKILDKFVNVDLRQSPGVDIEDNVETLEQISDSSADLIYACHVLEHVSRLNRLEVLKRWHKILKDSGVLRIAVPDFEKIVNLYQSGVQLETFIGHLYGGQNYEYNFHHYCWDINSIRRDLEKIGFKNVRRYDWRNTEHSDVDDFSQAYYPHMDKENGTLMSLNVEATK